MIAKRVLALVLVSVAAVPLWSATPQYTVPAAGGAPQPNRWLPTAVLTWNLNPSTGTNFTIGVDPAQVIQASFSAWTLAPNTNLSIVRGADSVIADAKKTTPDINLICFVCIGVNYGGSETLAITLTTSADAAGQSDGRGGQTVFAGQIIKADIFFNPAVKFVTNGSADGSTTQDLQTVATHEIGHFFGLDHSGVARAVMFPFAPDQLTTLSWDDAAGIQFLYPKSVPDFSVSTISGTVKNGTTAVFGAHVFADSTSTVDGYPGVPNIRKSPVGALTLPDGSYTLVGVPQGTYFVIAEPLDDPVTNLELSFYAPAFGKTSVDTNFTTRWH